MASPLALVWVVFILLTPLLVPLQIVVSNWLLRGRARGYGVEYEKRRLLLGAGTKLGVLCLFLLTFPVPVPLGFDPHDSLFVVLGGALYHVESFVRARWGDRSRRGSLDAPGVRAFGVGTSACVEEVLYRGGLSPLLESFGPTAFVLLSAVSFGAAHGLFGDWTEMAYKTLFGVVLAALFVGTGSLVPPLFVHLGYNGAYVQHGSNWSLISRNPRSGQS